MDHGFKILKSEDYQIEKDIPFIKLHENGEVRLNKALVRKLKIGSKMPTLLVAKGESAMELWVAAGKDYKTGYTIPYNTKDHRYRFCNKKLVQELSGGSMPKETREYIVSDIFKTAGPITWWKAVRKKVARKKGFEDQTESE